jgi:hypothetical protein
MLCSRFLNGFRTAELATVFGQCLISSVQRLICLLDSQLTSACVQMLDKLQCLSLLLSSLERIKSRLRCGDFALEQYRYKLICVAFKKEMVSQPQMFLDC